MLKLQLMLRQQAWRLTCTFSLYTHVYLSQPRFTRSPKFPYIVVRELMVVIYAWAFVAGALYGQQIWIEHPNYPSGPAAYFEQNRNIWIHVLGTFACMLANGLGE